MLLDTSGLLCLHHKAEPFHDQARTLYKQARIRLTHSYLLAEFVALCDAVSFILMQRRHITEALTTDHHFEQEGFRKMLG